MKSDRERVSAGLRVYNAGSETTMINLFEVAETNEMIAKENLDVRTITLGEGSGKDGGGH